MQHAVLERSHVRENPSPNGFVKIGVVPPVVESLLAHGITTPTPIQTATISDALAGRDILGQGRTGSGKTLAFGLPLLQRLHGGLTSEKHPRGVVLVPTRELALQVADALQPYAAALKLHLAVVCGGTSIPRQITALKNGVDILVATPGRLKDLISRRACSLDSVEIAILDEADQMADMGFLEEMRELLGKMPTEGQRMLFSATLDRGVDALAQEYLTNPARHSVDPSRGVVGRMTHHRIVVESHDKNALAAILAGQHDRVIVFVRTQRGADRVADRLRSYGANARALHGGMPQDARTRTLNELRTGTFHILVATDVAARGIDVDGVDLVLNVDAAGSATDYLHRAGRTARAGRSGTVVTLVLPHQRKGIARLFDKAGVSSSEYYARGHFDPALAALVGVDSERDIGAALARVAVRQAEHEVAALTVELERAQQRVTELRATAKNAGTKPRPAKKHRSRKH